MTEITEFTAEQRSNGGKRRSCRLRSSPFTSFLRCASVASALSVASLTAQAPASSWPQFRGSSALLGISQATLPAQLKVQWTYEAGDAIESSAAIADGVVYVGSGNGELHAVNLADGKGKWKYKASEDGIGESSPAVSGGLVYIGDLSGVVHAVDVNTGKAAWTFKTGTEVKSSPVVSGGKVLIGSYDSHLYALGAKDGKLAWKVQTQGYVHATPAVVDGIAYIAGCDEILRAIRIADGKEVFQLSSGAYTGASPAISNGKAYYGTYENEVLSVDLKAHRIVWRYKHPQRNFPFYSSAAIVGDRVFVGGRDKMLHALDLNTGKAIWTRTTGARIDSSPAVVGGRVYVGSSDGKLYVVDAVSGKSVQEFEAGGPLSASPAIADGKLVIGSADGKLFCLG
jgi:eukaryotic-like serine/threonine-protein kinase